MNKEPIAKAPKGRPSRTPIGKRNVLTVNGKDENYVYRVVNDKGDRIAMFEDAGYELVEAAEVRVGDKRVERGSAIGSKAEVSVGQGDKAFIMRIAREFYEEDQAAKEQHLKLQEEAIKQEALKNSDYGSVGLGSR